MVPLRSPPKRSAVVDWLRQQAYGQPINSKHTVESSTASEKDAGSVPAASSSLPVDCGQLIDSKHITGKNARSINIMLTDVAKQPTGTYQKPGFGIVQEKNDDNVSNSDGIKTAGDDDDDDVRRRKRSLLQRQECRVSFLNDVGQSKINSAGLLADGGWNFEYGDDQAADKSHSATAAPVDSDDDHDDSDLQKAEEQKSSMSNSASILFSTQPSSSGRSLRKASFIDLEVPDNWRSPHQSQMSDGSRHSGGVEIPPRCAAIPEAPAVNIRVASTPTTSSKSGQDGGGVDLSVISCSPITPRTTSDKTLRTRCRERMDTPSVEVHKEEEKDADTDDDDVTVIPCSPIIPSTSATRTGTDVGVHRHGDEEEDDDNIVVIPCTPVTPISSQTVENSSCGGKGLSASVEGQQGGKLEKEEVTIVPCSPITATTVQTKKNKKNKPLMGIEGISRFKVLFLYCSNKSK